MTARLYPSQPLQQPLPLSPDMASLPPNNDDDSKDPFPSLPNPRPPSTSCTIPQLSHQLHPQQQRQQQHPQHHQQQQPLIHPAHHTQLSQQQQQQHPSSSPIQPQHRQQQPQQQQPPPHPHSSFPPQVDLFSEIAVPNIVPSPPHDLPRDPPQFSLDPKASQQQQLAPQFPPHLPNRPISGYERKPADPSFYTTLPLAAAGSRITKRPSRADVHEHSSSPSMQSPSHPPTLPGQSSIDRRKAHRQYTQKSRNKVNSRFESLLDALPTPPPRLNPRSKAEILEYATETVIRLVSQNNKLELHLALSSSPQLEAWLTEQTKSARTVREVCQPIMRLFTIGLEWKGAEVWAIDSRAPMSTASLGQAWTFVPPPSGRRPSREEEARLTELGSFLDSGKGAYYTTTSNEALAVVYRTGKPAWLSCEYKASLGFEENPDFVTERTRLAQSYGITDVLFVPLILYNHVQIVVNFYNMRSRSPSENPSLQPQIDPKSSIKVASEAINIIARRFCSLPGVSEFAEQ